MAGHEEDESIEILTESYTLYTPREGPDGRVELDMGCGVGDYACALAKLFPDRRILAADVMLGRLRKLVKKIRRGGLENISPLRVEARMLLGRMLPDGSVDRIHLLCPDPWPKDRHSGHRLLTSDFVSRLHRVLKPEGIFHFSSDDEPYYEAVRGILETSKIFVEAPEAIADLSGIKSDFELRWNAGGKPVRHLAYRRIPRPPHVIGHGH